MKNIVISQQNIFYKQEVLKPFFCSQGRIVPRLLFIILPTHIFCSKPKIRDFPQQFVRIKKHSSTHAIIFRVHFELPVFNLKTRSWFYFPNAISII